MPPMRLTRTNVRELLDRHGLQPSRALGQNFLCDPNTIDKIVRLAGVEAGDRVIEIGPGLGSLTLGLLAAGAKVTAVEIDQYVLPALREVVAGHDATIVHGDALNLDWGPLLGTDDWSVIANLPYNVATPLVLDLLRDQPSLVRWLVMVQREVGERLAAEPGTSACGIPSVLRAYWGTASVVGSVSAEVFLPKPRVESVLVRIDRTERPQIDADFERLATLVRAGFGQRRKMLRRSLSSHLSSDDIEGCDVRPTDRAEQLDLPSWGRLARCEPANRDHS
ncbi:MAG: 16S rRNA (adenine1518-N6/adenine1519-N6)-dimethyltransferase [Acidimicrobiales bacterium]|jgi:16S rRNA (adenine1518-N6/adenine1519-N6)-dimethyltransferase